MTLSEAKKRLSATEAQLAKKQTELEQKERQITELAELIEVAAISPYGPAADLGIRKRPAIELEDPV